MGNNPSAKVIGIDAFKLDFELGSTLLLHDVFHYIEDSVQSLVCVKTIENRLGVEFCQNNVIITFDIDT